MPMPPTHATSWLAASGSGVPAFLQPSCVPDDLEVAFDGCTLTRSRVTVTDDHLTIRFDMRGRAASVEFPTDHVVVIPEGGEEKLDSLGGWGGYGDDGSHFFEWELRRQGAEAVRVVYLDDEDVVVAEERLPASGRFEERAAH
ncbi:hypothetical protein [Nocardioides ochotonae]|uniref:hypothetical protein n=1 Tax=Nocardioides ochotonae TaxID=2685869 RepID=UPI00140B5CC9|nr:hypothetical protein [Nocardioides ochotonae]